MIIVHNNQQHQIRNINIKFNSKGPKAASMREEGNKPATILLPEVETKVGGSPFTTMGSNLRAVEVGKDEVSAISFLCCDCEEQRGRTGSEQFRENKEAIVVL